MAAEMAISTASATTTTGVTWGMLHKLHMALVFNHLDAHFSDVLVPMFFALSGFLVTGSAFRTKSVLLFLSFRSLRIVPALFVEVSLSALVLGPLLTDVPLSRYFSDHKFFNYFGNIIGRVRFELPGLFLDNPVPEIVNRNLWTLPPEFYCYLIIAAMIITRFLFDRVKFSVLFAIATLALIFSNLFSLYEENITSAPTIVYYFFCGAVTYHWREYIPYNRWIFLTSLGAVYFHFLSYNGYVLIFPLFLTYVIVYLGLTEFPRVKFLQSGDYSYGIYLYGFPISQALVAVIPQLRGHGILVSATAIPLTFAFAALSWHFIEKPVLALKRRIGPKKVLDTPTMIKLPSARSNDPPELFKLPAQ